LRIEDKGLRIEDKGLRIKDTGLRIKDYRLRIKDSGGDCQLWNTSLPANRNSNSLHKSTILSPLDNREYSMNGFIDY